MCDTIRKLLKHADFDEEGGTIIVQERPVYWKPARKAYVAAWDNPVLDEDLGSEKVFFIAEDKDALYVFHNFESLLSVDRVWKNIRRYLDPENEL